MANITKDTETNMATQVAESSYGALVGEQLRQMKSPPGLFRRASVRTMQYIPTASSWNFFLKELRASERETEEQLARLNNIKRGNYYGQQDERKPSDMEQKSNAFFIDDPVSRPRRISEFEGTFLSSGLDLVCCESFFFSSLIPRASKMRDLCFLLLAT